MPLLKSQSEHEQADGGDEVGAGDHRPPPDRVEEPAEQQRAGEVGDPERDQIGGRGRVGDLEERGQDDREGEDDRVVDEGLGGHQREAQDRAPRIALEQRAPDLEDVGGVARLDLDLVAGVVELALARVALDALLDRAHELLGLVLAAVDGQPARALGHVAAHEHDGQAHDRAEAEGQPPAEVDREQALVEQHEGQCGAGGGARASRSR